MRSMHWLTMLIYRPSSYPSRRLAEIEARHQLADASARLLRASQRLLDGTGTIDQWRWAYGFELACAAALEAIIRGFGCFRG